MGQNSELINEPTHHGKPDLWPKHHHSVEKGWHLQ
jgi:hypothetical protein